MSRPPAAAAQPAPEAAPRAMASTLTGVWDWVTRSSTQQGDLRVEQEEWHLSEKAGRITGYYIRQVMTLSTDGQPFDCNGQLGFAKLSRVRLVGEVRGGEVALREVGAEVEPNPCDEGSRSLIGYAGRYSGDSLVLAYQDGAEQHLVRRAEDAKTLSLREPELGGSALTVAEPVTGVWEWQLRAVDSDGDVHVEREEWHLVEKDLEITGYYERSTERRREKGVFACSGEPQIRTATRYTIRGQRFGDKVTLNEIDYQQKKLHPCDNARRRLDRYEGAVFVDGRIVLSWSSGHQVLRRVR